MSLLEEFDISEKIPKELKNNIKYYHVFNSELPKQSLLFVTNDDKVYALGDNSHSKLGLSHYKDVESPEEVIELSGKRIKEFFVGKYYVLGHSSDGNLYSWGNNVYGLMGRAISNHQYFKPGPIELFSDIDFDIKQVCCGDNYVLVLLENGIVFMWGRVFNENNISGSSEDKYHTNNKPEELKSVNRSIWQVTNIGCDKSRFFVLCKDKIHFWLDTENSDKQFFVLSNHNKAYSWGKNDVAFLGHDNTGPRINEPTIISKLSTSKIIDIKCIDIAAYFLSADGKVYVCGHFPEYGFREPIHPTLIETDQKFTQLERIDNKTVVAINDKQIVYELKRKRVIETEFTSFEEYSVRKRGITYKTFRTDISLPMSSPDKSLSQSMEAISLSDDKLLCKLCLQSEIQSVVIPCGHTICNTCSQTLTTEICPFCVSPITTALKLHF